MAASVRISLKGARRLLERAADVDFDELQAAVDKATRASSARRKLAQPKREKKASRRGETAVIYAAVMERALGRCEACGQLFTSLNPPVLDHFFGRAKARQTVENCWALCFSPCNRAKTDNAGGAAYWLHRFIAHCNHRGYSAEADRARKKLAWVVARGGA